MITFSRAISILLLAVYALYLMFQLGSTGSALNTNTSDEENSRTGHQPLEDVENATAGSSISEVDEIKEPILGRNGSVDSNRTSLYNLANADSSPAPLRDRSRKGMTISLFLLVTSTLLIGICADNLIDGFRSLNEQGTLTEVFTGLIILPTAGNVAELITGTTVAAKDQMDLAIHIGVGSAIQIGLFVTPVMVLAGWGLGQEMSLHFSIFETIVLVASVFTVNFLILRGKTFCFEGAMMIACFLGVAYVSPFLIPSDIINLHIRRNHIPS
jgi:Ca2+:H+ antiporter